MNRHGTARVLRGALAGAVTTTLALGFHVLGGGALPDGVAIAVSYGGAIWLAIMIGRRRLSLPVLGAGVTAAQLLLHTVFTVSTAGGALQGDGAHAGHGDGGVLTLVLHHDGQAMWWAHALAGLLTVAALHRGERILQRLAELTAVVVRAVLRFAGIAAVPLRRPRRLVFAAHVPALATGRLATVTARRGPPVFVI